VAPDFIPAERRELIYKLLSDRGLVTIAELKALLKVSEITIRRDLDTLEGRGILERTHGGAISTRRMKTEPVYAQKDQSEREGKVAIGRAAAMLVQEGDTVLINSGSTTLQVIRHIQIPRVRIVTSNVGAVLEAGRSEVEIILVGGVYRPQSNSLVGGFAALTLQQIYGSRAFIGVDGISFKYGLTTPTHQEAEIAAGMIQRTRGQVIVVADHTKIGVVSNFVTAQIDEVDVLVTDENLDPEYRSEFESAGVRIVVASLLSAETEQRRE